ncbi:unnamed protein product [Chrysoparadoxa australica]
MCPLSHFLDTSASAKLCAEDLVCRFEDAACTTCPAGSACPRGGVRVLCGDNTFANGGSSTCSDCPEGLLCANGIKVPCGYRDDANQFENSGSCEDCPPGHRCADGLKFECEPGTFSPGGYPGGQTCIHCQPGYRSSAGASECLPCPAGTTSNHSSGVCSNCPEGSVPNACLSAPPSHLCPVI